MALSGILAIPPGGKAVSLIADPVGIYYDARQPSCLEELIATPCDDSMLARAETLTAELLRLGITKYNCYTADSGLPDTLTARLHSDPRPKVLLIDQVAGDLSIPGALASEEDFVAMVAAAAVITPMPACCCVLTRIPGWVKKRRAGAAGAGRRGGSGRTLPSPRPAE
jgi:capsule polysaccharide export protein KpsC/LpsZ